MVEEVPNIKSIDFSEDVQEANARAMVRRDRNHPSILFWSLGNETNDPADGRWVWEEDSTRIIHLRHGPEGDPYVMHTHLVHPHPWQRANVGQAHDFGVDANTDYVELFVNGRRSTPRRPRTRRWRSGSSPRWGARTAR